MSSRNLLAIVSFRRTIALYDEGSVEPRAVLVAAFGFSAVYRRRSSGTLRACAFQAKPKTANLSSPTSPSFRPPMASLWKSPSNI